MAICRVCGREVKFLKMITGRWACLDPEKFYFDDLDINERLVTGRGEIVEARPGEDNGPEEYGYRFHESTCIHGEIEWRNKAR